MHRPFLSIFLFFISGFLWGVIGVQSEERLPNIIYIMTDDLGYGDLGCYGQKVIKTPHIDQMAEEGIRLTDHYSGHTVCRPSRLVLWTGQHVGSTGLIGNRSRSLTGMEATSAALLKSAGYVTGGVGKWALGNVEDPSEIENPGHPNHNGFDYWFGYLNQGNAHNFYPPFLWENKEQVSLKGNVLMDAPGAKKRVSSERVTYSHDVMTDRALDFIRKHHESPFSLHIHWTIPHANNEGGRVLGDGMEVPDYGEYASEDWPSPEKGFAAMISRMDGDVGRLLALLKELEIDEETLLIFTSDNGPHEEGQHKHEFFDSNGLLKGYKRSMHDGGIRVPFIARWPGRIEAGRESDHPSAFWDFLPTVCEIAGVEVPSDVDGVSYLPTLLGKSEQEKHDYLFWASSEGETSIGMRTGNWKLVKYREKKLKQVKKVKASNGDLWRLYNLSADIGEMKDISGDHAEVVEKMKVLLKRDGLIDIADPVQPVKVALIGDSTVTDAAGWGKAFAESFRGSVQVTNYAVGGRSAKSWLAEGRMDAVLKARPDFALIQFGHNGQPGKGPARETVPETTYPEYLKEYVEALEAIGARPVIVSSVTRRDFAGTTQIRTDHDSPLPKGQSATRPLKPWADAAEAFAKEEGLPFIDLYGESVKLHNLLGREESASFSPKEGDITHFNEKGAAAIAELVIEELKLLDHDLVRYLKESKN
ncbi:sulfatase-like hydrolase/transferase [Verrucomicrobiales bacterium]|nr:sulfatase-like hydrolase/transferase [Verrucomicrobiales bacterium]MDB4358606.1 sulfatase-like hydrolase/transferase [Verrucomicrobiales bacterium]